MKTAIIDIADIEMDSDRTEGGMGNVEALALNMKKFGQINPIKVMCNETNYTLIAGRRRVKAAEVNGDKTIRAEIYEEGETIDKEGISLSENTARLEMNPIDEGVYFKKMLDKGETAENIGAIFCRSKSAVYQRAKLSNLSDAFKDFFRDGIINLSSAAMIAELTDETQKSLCKNLENRIKKGWYKSGITVSDLQSEISGVCSTCIGRDFNCQDCKDCKNRTHYSDSTLFPELQNRDDRCLDYKCYMEKWRSFISEGYMAARSGLKDPSIFPAIWLGNFNTKLPDMAKDGNSAEIDGQSVALINYSDARLAGDFSEEEITGFKARGVLHEGLDFNGSVFSRMKYVLYEDMSSDKAEEEPDPEILEELNAVYDSLPEEEKAERIASEVKENSWDRGSNTIERSFYSKVNNFLIEEALKKDSIPLQNALEMTRLASNLDRYLPEAAEKTVAERFKILLNQTNETVSHLLTRYLAENIYVRSVFGLNDGYGPLFLSQSGLFKSEEDAREFLKEQMAQSLKEFDSEKEAEQEDQNNDDAGEEDPEDGE